MCIGAEIRRLLDGFRDPRIVVAFCLIERILKEKNTLHSSCKSCVAVPECQSADSSQIVPRSSPALPTSGLHGKMTDYRSPNVFLRKSLGEYSMRMLTKNDTIASQVDVLFVVRYEMRKRIAHNVCDQVSFHFHGALSAPVKLWSMASNVDRTSVGRADLEQVRFTRIAFVAPKRICMCGLGRYKSLSKAQN